MPIKVLIADDHAFYREGVRAFLNNSPEIEVVGEAGNGEDAFTYAAELRPDVILMDVVMPDVNGYQATRRLSQDKDTAHIPVVMVSSKTQESDRVWGLRQGARAYVCKPANEAELARLIKQLAPAS